MGTGWFAAKAARAGQGKTVAVVGDGAVGLLGVLSAKQLGAERITAMSRHDARQKLALEFGATDIVTERGDAGGEDQGNDRRVRRPQCDRSRRNAGVDASGHPLRPTRRARRPRRRLPRRTGQQRGPVLLPRPPARRARPVRQYLPELIDLVWEREINPGKVSDLTLPLDRSADAYQAMDERRAITVLLSP